MDASTITRTDILKASDGMLQLPLFVIFTEPIDGMGPVMANMEAHLAYQVHLERERIMLGAGPFFADDGDTWHGEGMVIVRARNAEAARTIAEADPMHASGARRYRIRPWLLNEGGLSVRISFSTQQAELS